MEVIKHGNTYREVECKKCGALLSYCKSDIKINSGYDDDYFGKIHSYHEEYIKCLDCGKKIILNSYIDGEKMK